MSFPKRPHFRIIIVQDQKIVKIPKRYVEKYWKGTPNPIILRLPNAFEQKIFWEENNGEVLLQKNWNFFSKLMNLSHGCVLTFKYIGGSYFKVKIFGPKCLEINYSTINSQNEDVEAEETIEVIDESDDEIEIPMQAQRKRSGKRKFQDRNTRNMVKKAKRYPTNEAVNDDNPFFEVVMTKYYANAGLLWIPKQFVKEHLNNFSGISTLRVGKDNPMEMKISCIDNTGTSMFGSGWPRFRQNYNLQVDDVVKFVMTQQRPLSFIVTINRARNGPNTKNLQGNIEKRRDIGGTSRSQSRVRFVEASEGANMMKNLTFNILVKGKNNYPYLPKELMNIGCDDKRVELKMGRESWFVKVKYFHSVKSLKFGEGWRPFIEDCNLIGKTCSFELIDERKFVFNVSVVTKNH